MNSYKELSVFKRFIQLVVDINVTAGSFKEEENLDLSQYLRNSVACIPSLIAEGWRRGGREAFVDALSQSRETVLELESYLDLANSQDFPIPKEKLQQDLADLRRLLDRYMKSINDHLKNQMVKK